MIKNLEKLGLTSGEARVYLSLLRIGESTTGKVITDSQITGSKVYDILNRLIQKGLVSYVYKRDIKYFSANSVVSLLSYLKQRQKELIDDIKDAENLIPLLEKMRAPSQNIMAAKVFEGYGGIETVFSLILDVCHPGETYYAFSLGEELHNPKFVALLLNHHRRRITKKVSVKILAQTGTEKLFDKIHSLHLLKIRFVPHPTPLGVFIFGNFVATFSFDVIPRCFLIESTVVAKSYKDFFSSLWKEGKKVNFLSANILNKIYKENPLFLNYDIKPSY